MKNGRQRSTQRHAHLWRSFNVGKYGPSRTRKNSGSPLTTKNVSRSLPLPSLTSASPFLGRMSSINSSIAGYVSQIERFIARTTLVFTAVTEETSSEGTNRLNMVCLQVPL